MSTPSIAMALAGCEDSAPMASDDNLEVREVRRRNLGVVLQEFRTNAALAKKLDVDASYISQLKKGYREIGNQTARAIERAAKKPKGWLDTQQPEAWGQLLMARQAGRPVFTDSGQDARKAWLESVLSEISEDDLDLMVAVAVRALKKKTTVVPPEKSED